MKETNIQNLILLESGKHGIILFRNQVGAYKLADGRFLRSGLCVGSSDLIGLMPNGRFLAVEVKKVGGMVSPEQVNFLKMVNKKGGLGVSCYSVEDFLKKVVNNT